MGNGSGLDVGEVTALERPKFRIGKRWHVHDARFKCMNKTKLILDGRGTKLPSIYIPTRCMTLGRVRIEQANGYNMR